MSTTQFFGVVQSADQQGNLITELQIPRDVPVLSGNNVAVGLVYSTTAETITVTDDQANVYTKRADVTGGARHQMWTCENITNGPRIIKIQVSGSGSSYLSGWWGEASGVGAYSTQNATAGTSTTPQAGSITPPDGALIVMGANQDQLATPFLTLWTPDAGYTTMCADLCKVFLYAQWKLHTTGATNPGCTMNTSRTWTATAIAWVADTSKGTDPPTTIRIDRMTHNSLQAFISSPWVIQGPSANADTIIVWCENSPAAGDGLGNGISGVTDTSGNTWRRAGVVHFSGGGGYNECWYANRPASSNVNVISIAFAGGSAGDCFTTFIALKNTLALAVPDSATSTTGTDAVNTSILGTTTEPSQLHCMVLSLLGVQSNTVLSVDSGKFVSCSSTPQVGSPAPLMQNNGYCVDYPTNTTVIQRTWTLDAAPGDYQELNVVFLGVPPPATRDLEGFRFRDDDGSETIATWLAAQDTNISRVAGLNTRLRILTNAASDPPNEPLKIQYRRVGDNQWQDIN